MSRRYGVQQEGVHQDQVTGRSSIFHGLERPSRLYATKWLNEVDVYLRTGELGD